ncbi:T9SS type A sorting domain-containing protein [bacterium]|nr:T9SS type A sorting domain-containing protein [bacterium]
MSSKKVLSVFFLVGFSICAFADGGYTSHHSGDRPVGHADWWTEGETTIDYPVRIEVVDSSVGIFGLTRGQFAIGGTGPEFTQLMRNFHWPDSIAGEHFVLYIDGTYYSFANYTVPQRTLCGEPPVSLFQIDDYFVGSDTTYDSSLQMAIVSHWQIPVGVGGIIDFYQILKPISMIFGPDTCGLARINFRAFNNDISPHNIGIKLLVDALIGTSDRPYIAIAGTYSTLSQFFSSPVPRCWQGADNIDFSLATTIAAGILRGGDATPPDYFAIGQNSAIWRYMWVMADLGCHPDSEYWDSIFPSNPTGDVAFLIQWNPRSVPVDSHFDWVTYYGFGSGFSIWFELYIWPIPPEISCHDCTIDTLIDVYTTVIRHDILGYADYNDTICISPPYPLSVDTVFWDTLLFGGHILNDTCILLDSLPSDNTAAIDWVVHIPESLHLTGLTGNLRCYINSPDLDEPVGSSINITIPMFSGIPPTMTLLTAPSFFVNCTTFTIDVEYSDDEGIDQSSVLPNINGYWSDGFVNWHSPVNPLDDTFFVDVPGTLFTVDSLETVFVFIPPIADGCGCRSAETLRTTIIWDDIPPSIVVLFPIADSTIYDDTVAIYFETVDSGAGIDIDNLQLSVRYGDFYDEYDAGDLFIYPADSEWKDVFVGLSLVFAEIETVDVCITSQDRVFACEPNVVDTCWSFIVQPSGIDEFSQKPNIFELSVHPNPFNSSVEIAIDGVVAIYELPIQVAIYDLSGNVVAIPQVRHGIPDFIGEENRTQKRTEWFWTPDKTSTSGIYFVQVSLQGQTITKRIVYIK